MKHESVESKIIQYFSEESLEKVQLLFGIVKGIVARREPAKKKKVNPRWTDEQIAAAKSKPQQKSNSGDSVKDAGLGLSTSSALKDKTESGYVQHKSN